MSELSISRLNSITSSRLQMRTLININYGYNYANDSILPDRFSFYTDLISDTVEDLRI